MKRICKGCSKEYTPRHDRDYRCIECYSKNGSKSKRKGSANELRFAHKLQEQFDKHGLKYMVRRTPRSGAIHEFEPADLMFSGLPSDSIFKRHFELKNSASWSIEDWYGKAKEIEKERETNRLITLVIRKPNSSQAYVIVDEDDFIKLLIENEILKKQN